MFLRVLLLLLCETQRHRIAWLRLSSWEEPNVLGLSCKEITVMMRADSFTVRDAMRSQEWLAPNGGHSSPPF